MCVSTPSAAPALAPGMSLICISLSLCNAAFASDAVEVFKPETGLTPTNRLSMAPTPYIK